ncbi:MAG TPA: GAF domain-containing protein [Candidatus Elarobacter sp.]|nr:GAF domain-containing protein [Candidatus Elarobacter sp.]
MLLTAMNLVIEFQASTVIDMPPTTSSSAPCVPCSSAVKKSPAAPIVNAPFERESFSVLPMAARHRLAWLRFAAIECILLFAALIAAIMWKPAYEQGTEKTALIPQWAFIAVGVVGGLLHIFWVEPKNGIYTPSFDPAALAWFGLAIVGSLLPRLRKFGFGGATVEMEAGLAEETSTQIAELLQRWLTHLNLFYQQLPQQQNPALYVKDFLGRRSAEAHDAIAAKDEAVRLSIWNYDEAKGGLLLLQSNEIGDEPTKRHVFHLGEGLMGRAFRDQELVNVANGQKEPGWVEIEGATRKFNGVLLAPFVWGNEKLGVLSIDREAKRQFEPLKVAIANALALVAAHVLGSPITRNALAKAESADIVPSSHFIENVTAEPSLSDSSRATPSDGPETSAEISDATYDEGRGDGCDDDDTPNDGPDGSTEDAVPD